MHLRRAARGRRCSCARCAQLDQRVEVDAGVDLHVLEHVHEILGDDVAGRARRVRAAAEPADRRVEPRARPASSAGEHVREPGAAGVVEVQPDASRSAIPARSSSSSSVVDPPRRRHAGRVAERDAVGAARRAGAPATCRDRARARRRLRTGSRTRSTRSPRPARPASCASSTSTCAPSSDSSTERRTFFWLCVSRRAHHDLELVGPGRDRPLGALARSGTSARVDDARDAAAIRAMTSSAPAIGGIASADTNDTASIRRSPVRAQRVDQPHPLRRPGSAPRSGARHAGRPRRSRPSPGSWTSDARLPGPPRRPGRRRSSAWRYSPRRRTRSLIGVGPRSNVSRILRSR